MCKDAQAVNTSGHCNRCHAEYLREWRKRRRLAGNPSRPSAAGLQRKRARQMELRKTDPAAWAKHAAHLAVADALRSGRMVRPDGCSECGAVGKVQGHHEDYAKRLEIRWLCLDCHIEVHRARL